MSLEEEVLAAVRPTGDQRRHMERIAKRLVDQAQAVIDRHGLPAEASVQGSMAKDTWLAGTTDIDMFLLADPATPEAELPGLAQRVANGVLQSARARYAQHPYLVGQFEGMQVDMVPAYAVAEASQRMSAVDRTPFHTAWVRQHLDADGRDQVRLAKQWLKGVGAYGAETSIAGFSGYLVEVLMVRHGSFAAFVEWLAEGAQPRLGSDDEAVLAVPDPVDAARNCAAAVSGETLDRAIEAARAYRGAPSRRFFFPPPPRPESARVLERALQQRNETWLGIEMPDAAQRLDIVFPQFQKAGRRIADALERAGFHVVAQATWTDDALVGMQWRLQHQSLPATRTHGGPAAHSPHAERFRQKWEGSPDAASEVREVAGRLQVEVHQHDRTPEAWLRTNIRDLGKHADAALKRSRILADPAAVVPAWSPAVADFILERRPWQR